MILSACASATSTPTVFTSPIAYQTLAIPYTPTVIPEVVGIALPTPTTISYTVVQGDTLIGIAGRYGITLETLLTANPSIQTTILSVGTTLIIPNSIQVTGEPTPTPALLPVLQAHCWSESDGGLWCFALFQNQYAETIENIAARFTLLDSEQKTIADDVAYGLLDILPPGRSMPLALHFSPPVLGDGSVRVQLINAIRLLPGDARYLPVMLEGTLVSVATAGLTAHVTGKVVLVGPGTSSQLWVLAVAYDAEGQVVGVRRWDSTSPMTATEPVSFNFLVSSLGPRIDKVEFLLEARP
jgi:hypothetical protein